MCVSFWIYIFSNRFATGSLQCWRCGLCGCCARFPALGACCGNSPTCQRGSSNCPTGSSPCRWTGKTKTKKGGHWLSYIFENNFSFIKLQLSTTCLLELIVMYIISYIMHSHALRTGVTCCCCCWSFCITRPTDIFYNKLRERCFDSHLSLTNLETCLLLDRW